MTDFPIAGTPITHLFVVTDIERSRDWYTNVLGAELYREYGGTSVVFKLLDTWLVLVTGSDPTDDKPTVTFATPSDPDTVSAQLIFGVKDCRGTYEELSSRGAEFLTPPVDHGFEIRAFFRDPDGHLFEISETGAY